MYVAPRATRYLISAVLLNYSNHLKTRSKTFSNHYTVLYTHIKLFVHTKKKSRKSNEKHKKNSHLGTINKECSRCMA